MRAKDCDSLFISYVKPHKAVTSQTLSRWINSELKECGVQTDLFTSCSTRHASTSSAARKGVSTDLIKKAAGKTGHSKVFANFYNRPIVDAEEFSNNVLLT